MQDEPNDYDSAFWERLRSFATHVRRASVQVQLLAILGRQLPLETAKTVLEGHLKELRARDIAWREEPFKQPHPGWTDSDIVDSYESFRALYEILEEDTRLHQAEQRQTRPPAHRELLQAEDVDWLQDKYIKELQEPDY